HDSPIVKLAFSPDGSKLVSSSESHELVLWDAPTLTPIHRYELQPDIVVGIAFEPSSAGFCVARINGSWQRYAVSKDATKVHQKLDTTNKIVGDDSAMKNDLPKTYSENEPNNLPAAANPISTNSVTSGVIGAAQKDGQPDIDLYRFHASKGEKLVLVVDAARS